MGEFGDGGFEVLFNRFPELTVALEKAISQMVRKAAFDIQAMAMATAPVATGFLKSSIYVVTHDRSTYASSLNKAFVKGHDVAKLMDEVEPPPDDQTAYVAVGAEYGIYVEYGTSKMAAQPYLTPAYEFVRPSILEAMARLEEKMMVSGIQNTSYVTGEE